MKILNIDLWKCYVTYVRETKSSLPNFRVKMKQAYDFAVEHVGIDFHSTTLWADYINFLKSEATSGSYAETQKTNAIRKAYHQVVMTPLMNIEQMWRDYCNFEQMSSKAAAKRNIDAVSRTYVHSKRASAELESCTRGLIRGATSVPLLGTVQEIQQLKIWKQFIAWEKRNPTRTESNALLVKRVLYAYEQCLLCYSHCAEIWYEAALYLQRASETGNTQFKERWAEEAAMLYERATTISLSNSPLLHFAFADFEESRLKFDKAEAIYKKLLEKKDIQPTLVFVQYMKFSRRTEGIKAARNVFKQAREDPRCSHQIYVAAALMEYNISKDKAIAYKIFELGLKKFADDPTYVLAYLDHLSHLNEDNNTRVLFEKVLATMPAEKTKEVWDKYVEFESNVGDLASLLKVEKKRAASMRGNSKMDPSQCREALLLVDRYSYLGLIPCSETELKVMEHPCAAKVDLEPASGSSGLQSTRAKDTIAETSLSGNISRPDTSHMLPFRPSATSGVGMNAVPGGHFPLPSEVAYLMSRIPPPQCFNGPFVNLNELVHLIKTSDLPSSLAPGPPDRPGKKRRAEGRDDSDDETQSSTAPPTNDIYRARQQKRAHTVNSS
ncbi:Cleavage stimulation factor subunit 3 [Geodia barretti]|nr:Cleavage stimulation factor subunit 3 [Geodia barretti]